MAWIVKTVKINFLIDLSQNSLQDKIPDLFQDGKDRKLILQNKPVYTSSMLPKSEKFSLILKLNSVNH